MSLKKSSPPQKKRDPKKTRAKLLQSATKFFAQAGYEGTSLNQILAKAQVNKRMVYHYFGSKENLYRAIHIHQWQLLYEWFTQSLTNGSYEWDSNKIEDTLLKALEIFHEFCSSHQDFLRLLMWDGLEGGKVSRSIWKEIRGPIYYQVENLVKAAQKEGVISKDLKANHLIISFMGAILFFFSASNALKDIFGKDPFSAIAVEERKAQTLALFKHILTRN